MLTRRWVLVGLLSSLLTPFRVWAQPLPPSNLRLNSMAVAFDAEAHGSTAAGGTSIPDFTLTIGAGVTDGAVCVCIAFAQTTPTGVTVTIGGSAASAIANTDGNNVSRSLMFGLATGSSTGAKTISVSWTETANAAAVAISASGVDQTTPFNNGAFSGLGFGVQPSITITSATGDLTIDVNSNGSGNAPTTPNQTQRAAFASDDFQIGCGVSTAAGAATVTHTWAAGGWVAQSGANFKAAAGAGGTTWPGWFTSRGGWI